MLQVEVTETRPIFRLRLQTLEELYQTVNITGITSHYAIQQN